MLKQILNQKIKDSSLEELKEKLGYQSIKKLEKSIDKFISTNTIYDWLNSGFYDLTNDAKTFFEKLCRALDIDENEINKQLQDFTNLKNEIDKFKDSYIFVNTNFKRTTEPILALAFCESKRRISLFNNERFFYKSIDEILKLVSNIIIEHYKINDGKCSIWGDIVNYQLSLFGKFYTFSNEGKLIAEENSLDVNIATLKIK